MPVRGEVDAARCTSRHVLDWLRVLSERGPHWLHQERVEFIVDADNPFAVFLADEYYDQSATDDESDDEPEGWREGASDIF